MKRIVLISMTLLLAAAGLHAQEILARFSTDRITCKYSYTTTVPIALNFSGDAVVQGECYHFSGNGLEIYCDGESRPEHPPGVPEILQGHKVQRECPQRHFH